MRPPPELPGGVGRPRFLQSVELLGQFAGDLFGVERQQVAAALGGYAESLEAALLDQLGEAVCRNAACAVLAADGHGELGRLDLQLRPLDVGGDGCRVVHGRQPVRPVGGEHDGVVLGVRIRRREQVVEEEHL